MTAKKTGQGGATVGSAAKGGRSGAPTDSPAEGNSGGSRAMPKQVTKILLPLNADWEDLGWRIEISWRLRMSGGGLWAAAISHRRMSKTGSMKEGKPEHVLTLCHDDPIELLRQIADLFAAGEVAAP